MITFYMPTRKYEYVEFLERIYPGGKFRYMGIKQLKAIYIKERRKYDTA